VLAREGGAYRVLVDGAERQAILRGKAKRERERAVAGDRVRFDPATMAEDILAIEAVEPRTSLLERRIPGGRGTRPVAANVDQVVVVIAAADPAPIPQLLDRLLVVAEANDIPPLVVINKIDLAPAADVVAHLAASGYEILMTAAKRGDGLEQLRGVLSGKVSVFTGPSGAGKSSLMNALEPGLGLLIGEVSAKLRRGTHTTVAAIMVPLAIGGFVVDTPGFSEVGMWAIDRAHLDECFPEFRPAIGQCKFDDCTHRTEPACAVRALLEAGTLPASRYDTYLTLFAELADLPEEWQ
jgi:ribosome biogenesis GTPase / thiamine phosphate phosphatase